MAASQTTLYQQAVTWRAAQATADQHRQKLRDMVRTAHATGSSKYRIHQLLDGLVSEPTIAKWCASERGTM